MDADRRGFLGLSAITLEAWSLKAKPNQDQCLPSRYIGRFRSSTWRVRV